MRVVGEIQKSKEKPEETLFGLELEFTGITKKAAAYKIAKALGVNWIYDSNGTYEILDRKGRKWEVKFDGTIDKTYSDGSSCDDDNYAVELATPKLTLKDMDLLLKVISDIHKAGALVNDSCGIHVHVDASKQTPRSLIFLTKQMFLHQDMLFCALKVKPNRESYCSKLTPELIYKMKNIKSLKKLSKIYENKKFFVENQRGERHRNLNMKNSFSHNKKENHLEYRLFNATFKTSLIRAYIKFCLAFSKSGIDYVQNHEKLNNTGARDAIKRLNAKTSPKKAITLKHLKKIDFQNQIRRKSSDYDRRELDLYLKRLNISNKDRRLLTAGLELKSNKKFDGYQLGII